MLRILSELLATLEAVQVYKQRYSVNVENKTSFSSLNNMFFFWIVRVFPFYFLGGGIFLFCFGHWKT